MDIQEHRVGVVPTDESGQGWVGQCFSTTGRLNRAGFLGRTLAIYAALYVGAFAVGLLVAFALAVLGATPSEIEEQTRLLGVLLGLTAIWPLVCVSIKRLHDLGRPGSHDWLLFIPVYNIYLAAIMLFKKGQRGSNAFGPDPLAARRRRVQVQHATA